MIPRLVRETMPVIAIRFEVLQQRVSRLSYGRDNGAGRRELKKVDLQRTWSSWMEQSF